MAMVRPKKKKTGDKLTDIFICVCLVLVIFCTLYPLWHVLMYSVSDSRQAMSGGLFLLPRGFSLLTYKMLFQTKRIFVAFKNTFAKTIVGTMINLAVTTLTAYALSLDELKGRRAIQLFIYFTMLFSGGIIPTYILLKDLHMLDTFWVYVIPAALSPYNMFIMRSFFKTIPKSLSESAMLDGASHMQILGRIILPLSKPCIATISLYYARANWNSYMDGVLYVNDSRLELLQVYLRRLISSASAKGALAEAGDLSAAMAVTEESMKMTVIAVSLIPIIILYLGLQKYFVKGVGVGAVKG